MKKSIISIFLVVMLTVLLAGCSPHKKDEGNVIRVAFFPNITHSQALVGKSEGWLQKNLGNDYKIEWKMFNAGPSEVEALFAGEVDIGYIGPVPALNGYVKSGGDVSIIAGATQAGAILVSRKDLEIRNVKELAGKKVAVPQFGNTQDLCLRYLLKENGLKDVAKGGTVEILQVANPDVKTLLDKGDIDAALVPEPWGSILVKEINANIVLDYNEILREGRYPTTVIVVRTDFLKQHPDIVKTFVKTHIEISDYINNNPDRAKTIVNDQISELTGKALSKDIMDAAFGRMTVGYDPEKDAVMEFSNLAYDMGIYKDKPDISELFKLQILDEAMAK